MRQESLVTKYDYDFENDSIFFYGSDKKYKTSADLDGIILDISEDHQIMAIEILDASKRFNLAKEDLRNVRYFEAAIDISQENIRITMKMSVSKRNKLVDKGLNALGLNSINLPISSQEIALNC
ncbi:DUF2283 domain-containing protein [Methanosarcina sp. MSH10X1]|uniref:DUF2283 domain-containing protein n=1 Tax=Methanosarcina sp. MSH10X1 TaxID=2507075 RepID=UPI000FFCBD70|nr:DUF2283 domain-containing protein [Methanosarcina sp. MSH10X1]RXA20255.1 DUF2283 domain-containing protein [Methanosarcina sp. MSH10X1]